MSLHPYDRNPLKRTLAEVLFQSQGGVCQLCKGEKVLEIDHMDGNPTNWALVNLRLLCHDCNISERNRLQHSVKIEREKSPGTHPQGYEYSAGEPKKHDIMREEWDRWVRGKGRSKFPLFEALKEGRWEYRLASELAYNAPAALGIDRPLGSSKTYWVYVLEDASASANIFEKIWSKGELRVRYTAFFIDNVLNMVHGGETSA